MPRQSSGSVRFSYPRYTRDEVIARLAAGSRELAEKLPLRQVVLFGSYATGRFTAGSDVDVLIVYAGEPRADAFAIAKRTLKLRGVEPHVYTEKEAAALAPMLERMASGGVVIYLASSAALDEGNEDPVRFQPYLQGD